MDAATELGRNPVVSEHQIQLEYVWRMNRLTQDGTAEPVSRGQILRHARGQGNAHFPCSAHHEQDWQPSFPVDPYSAICDDHTYIQTDISSGNPFKYNVVSLSLKSILCKQYQVYYYYYV